MNQILHKYGKRALFPILLLAVLLYFIFQQQPEELSIVPAVPPTQEALQSEPQQLVTTAENIIVDVKGQVRFPGVYELTTDDRIIDAIERAGGYTEAASTKWINHAKRLQDEMIIYVPFEGEEVEEIDVAISTPSSGKSGKININTADETALTSLPGIGPAKAQAIIAYRTDVAKFQTPQDLTKVSGIGQKTFEKLESLIDVK